MNKIILILMLMIPMHANAYGIKFEVNGFQLKAKEYHNWNYDYSEIIETELLFKKGSGSTNQISVPGLLINKQDISYDKDSKSVTLYEGQDNQVTIEVDQEGSLNENDSFYGGYEDSTYKIYVVEEVEGNGEDGIEGSSYKKYAPPEPVTVINYYKENKDTIDKVVDFTTDLIKKGSINLDIPLNEHTILNIKHKEDYEFIGIKFSYKF